MSKRLNFICFAILFALPLACATSVPIPLESDLGRISGMWPDVQLKDIQEGRTLFLSRCSSCHALHLPSELTEDEWERAMKKMKDKAQLSEEDNNLILRYVISYSKNIYRSNN